MADMAMVVMAMVSMGMERRNNRRGRFELGRNQMECGKRIVDIHQYIPVLQEIMEEGKAVSLTVTGNSMSPLLIHGRDQVLMCKGDGTWKQGDIAFFQRKSGEYIMHRICKVDQLGRCYFVGDAQNWIEGPIEPEQIFAKIIAVNRKGKWIRPGDFLWEFFEHVWIRMIPWRQTINKIYSRLKKLI